jgi:hypothetical protein
MRPLILKQNIKYHDVILVEIWIACVIYKLA